MRKRHEARMWAVQLLYQLELNRTGTDEAFELFWQDRTPTNKVRAFTEELVRGVIGKRDEIDARLATCVQNWDLKRMAVVDRNVLRMGAYEMMHREDIPPVVTINEAVDVAKELSSRESGQFVNGILDRLLKDLGRPARTVRPANWPSAGER